MPNVKVTQDELNTVIAAVTVYERIMNRQGRPKEMIRAAKVREHLIQTPYYPEMAA